MSEEVKETKVGLFYFCVVRLFHLFDQAILI